MGALRLAAVVAALLAALVLSSCPGSVLEPLPPGGGAGSYNGQLTAEDETTVLGTFTLTIDTVGAISGEGLLNGQQVTISGLLTGDSVDATISETLSGLNGRFRGARTGSGYSGDFTINRLAGEDDLNGFWDCAPAV